MAKIIDIAKARKKKKISDENIKKLQEMESRHCSSDEFSILWNEKSCLFEIYHCPKKQYHELTPEEEEAMLMQLTGEDDYEGEE